MSGLDETAGWQTGFYTDPVSVPDNTVVGRRGVVPESSVQTPTLTLTRAAVFIYSHVHIMMFRSFPIVSSHSFIPCFAEPVDGDLHLTIALEFPQRG